MFVNIKTGKIDRGAILSYFWIFVIFNYFYCDILGLYDASVLKELLTGTVGGFDMTPGFLLGAAVLMEISIMMIILSRLLPHKLNRLANIIAGAIMTIVRGASFFFGSGLVFYYVLFSIIEMITTALIVYLAWTWPSPIMKI